MSEIVSVSASLERLSVREEEKLCMLIDTSTCIGCKACEVACVEWNDLKVEPEQKERVLSSYQTMPDMTPAYWNLIRFNEVPVDRERRPVAAASESAGVMLLMRKDMCLHCAEPGCLFACPAEGAIVKLASGIVDFQGEHCIGCGYCLTGCPFDVPKLDRQTRRVHKCTMCSDRVENGLGPACVKACPTGCLEFGGKAEMKARAEQRAEQLRGEGFAQAGVYDPPGVGGTGVIYVLHHADRPELYGGLPREPRVAAPVRLWKGPLKWAGGFSMAGAVAGAALHLLIAGPQRLRERARADAPPERDVVRYTLPDRLLHWTVAASFLFLMLSGLGIWSPRLSFLLALSGGGQAARALHPIAGVLFSTAVFAQLVKWLRDLRLVPSDWRWLRGMRRYIAGRTEGLPPSGRFNAGQKLLFFAQVALALLLLVSGVPLWFPEAFSRALREWAALLHSTSALLAIVSLIVHVHMALVITRGALRGMIEGRVSEGWARHHHASWAEEQLGPPPP